MNISAIEHSAYDTFCYPLNENELEINILTGKDVTEVRLIYGDPFAGKMEGGSFVWTSTELVFTEKKELESHLRWTAAIRPQFKRVRYYFKLSAGGETLCFMENGFMTEAERLASNNFSGTFTFPWMNAADICTVPEWAAHTVWYQIFPARFCRGQSDFIPDGLSAWPKAGGSVKNTDVFGGNLQGIIDKLDYLADLGISGLYLNPVNLSPSQHKYDTSDYLSIDPAFGNGQTLKTLVEQAHRRNIRIMLDGVFNHSGSDFFAWRDVLQHREQSKYADWFMVNDYDFDFQREPWGPESNAGHGKFYAFAFCDAMPKLNTNNPEVRAYLLGVCSHWVQEYDIDGIRLDVANELSHAFCKELRAHLKRMKPDFYIMGEVWHNAMPWLRGDEFDSVMNYPLQSAIADFCAAETGSVKQLEFAINRCYSMYYRQINRALFNQMDSHDTPRLLHCCRGDKNAAAAALALLFLMPGSVCLYYGTEVFLDGGSDPDNRRCMPWAEIQAGAFDDDIAFVKRLIALRKTHPAFSSDEMHFAQPEGEGTDRVLRLEKVSADGAEIVTFILNASQAALPVSVPQDAEALLYTADIRAGVLPAGTFVILKNC